MDKLARQIPDQPGQPQPADVCEACGFGVHLVTDRDNGEPWQGWQHESVADEIFCGLVMRAGERGGK
jgi:hypothetical protein